MRRLIVALAGSIAAAGASATDHIVVHGLSSHSGERIEARTGEKVQGSVTTIEASWRIGG